MEFLIILVVVATTLALRRQGLLAGAAFFFNVLLAGLVAFNFWEPLARALGRVSPQVDAFADALWLSVLFAVTLVVLRLLTGQLLPRVVYFSTPVQPAGAILSGVLAGYLVAGILLCILQTLPLPKRFLGYDGTRGAGLGRPDRVWLAIVHRTSGRVLDRIDEAWFDADGSFAERYARYRRTDMTGGAARVNQGEFEPVLSTQKAVGEEDEETR